MGATSIEWTDRSGRAVGVIKTAAKKAGVTVEGYISRRTSGEKWCVGCKTWHQVERFGRDTSRHDGLSASCLESRRRSYRRTYRPIPIEQHRPRGTQPHCARDGDKRQARHRVNREVRRGLRPPPNSLPCVDCGHAWDPTSKRHEYDHYLGYASVHHGDVQPVCTSCHTAREIARGQWGRRRSNGLVETMVHPDTQ